MEEPFRRLVRETAHRLPAPINGLMETEKGVFAKILKNDWGRGGAWDYYWGAFYPKGGKRIRDAQLSTWINRDQLEFGFFIGHYGSDQRQRFLQNCSQYREELVDLLGPTMGEDFVYGDDKGWAPDSRGHSLSQWLETIDEAGIDVSTVIARDRVLELSAQDLIDTATCTFELLFPFVLLATSEDPMPEIIGCHFVHCVPMRISPVAARVAVHAWPSNLEARGCEQLTQASSALREPPPRASHPRHCR